VQYTCVQYKLTVGLHYFNPVQLMQLTEVISTEHTDPAVFELTKQWSNSLGKTSVACGDTPGFIVNRLLVPALAQAMLLVRIACSMAFVLCNYRKFFF